jgi:hypothetical protein
MGLSLPDEASGGLTADAGPSAPGFSQYVWREFLPGAGGVVGREVVLGPLLGHSHHAAAGTGRMTRRYGPVRAERNSA